jgi:acyl dehydratase
MNANGRYLEDFQPGEEFRSGTRTITDRDLLFCTIWNGDGQAHSNEAWARKTPWGARIVHGDPMLGVGLGLVHSGGLFDGTLVGYEGMDIRYPGPIFVGDTISASLKIDGVDKTAGRVDATLVVRNETHQAVAVQASLRYLVARRS